MLVPLILFKTSLSRNKTQGMCITWYRLYFFAEPLQEQSVTLGKMLLQCSDTDHRALHFHFVSLVRCL